MTDEQFISKHGYPPLSIFELVFDNNTVSNLIEVNGKDMVEDVMNDIVKYVLRDNN